MKKTAKWIVAALAAALALLVMGCKVDSDDPVAVESITLDETTLTLKPGETRKLTATVKPDNADDKTLVWYTSPDAAATVDEDGTVTALKRGNATITAATGFSQDDKTATCKVTVVVPTMEDGVIDDYGALSKYTGKETDVVIPDDVTSIGDEAFSGCTSITKVTIPDSVKYIGRKAFQGCTNLKSVTIGNGVTGIDMSAFWGCTSLESVVLPDSVTSIGSNAFQMCTSLASVEIPASVTEIKSTAFNGCEKLTKVTYKGTLEQWCGIDWGDWSANPLDSGKATLYLGDKVLTVADIPDSVTEIKDYAFYNCKSLTSVKIPDSVTEIKDYAFYNCKSLTSVKIPDSVTTLGKDAFRGCDGLTSMTIPAGVAGTEEGCKLSDCKNLTSVKISKGADGVWACTLKNCANLTSVTIADGVTSVGEKAFWACKKLTDVTIPASVTSFKDDSFAFCESLESLTIPASVTEIGSGAFMWCEKLKTINYEGTQAQWNAITKGTNWNLSAGYYTIRCTDGDITK